MLQTGLIPNAHSDLVTDASYDFYGLRLATASLDQRVKIWLLDDQAGTWSLQDEWKAHDAALSKVSWAHPQFGDVIASSSFDRTVKIWEQTTGSWVERAVLLDSRGTVRAVEFAPHHFGLKLATISTDNFLRIYECLEQPSLATWSLSEEIDASTIPNPRSSSPGRYSRAHTLAISTPTQINAPLEGAPAVLVAQALQQQQQQDSAPSKGRPGLGNREADGGWCISWCKDRYWGEVIACGCGVSATVKIIQLSPSRRPETVLVLDASPPSSNPVSAVSGAHTPRTAGASTFNTEPSLEKSPPYAITTISWAPSCGRSYHLIATGGRDGRVRVWKVVPPAGDEEDVDLDSSDGLGLGGRHGRREASDDDEEERVRRAQWTAQLVADFDDHAKTGNGGAGGGGSVGRVEWNVTGTVLSSSGSDGRVRLWKATSGGSIWRPAGSIGVEQQDGEEGNSNGRKNRDDVDMNDS